MSVHPATHRCSNYHNTEVLSASFMSSKFYKGMTFGLCVFRHIGVMVCLPNVVFLCVSSRLTVTLEWKQRFPKNWTFFGHSTNMAQGQSPWMDGLPFNVQTHIAHMILAQQLLLRPPWAWHLWFSVKYWMDSNACLFQGELQSLWRSHDFFFSIIIRLHFLCFQYFSDQVHF